MLFNIDQKKTMCEYLVYVAFNKATNGQKDIKHGMWEKNLAEMSLRKIAGEKLPRVRSR